MAGTVRHGNPALVPTPTAAGHATTKTYVDDALALKLDSSSAAELIRDTMGTALVQGANITVTVNDGSDTITVAVTGAELTANKDAASGYPGLDSTSRIAKERMAAVLSGIRTGNVTTSVTSDASTNAGNNVDLNANGNITINAPTGAGNWQKFEWHVLANGADRTVTFSGFLIVGPSQGGHFVPNGEILVAKAEWLGNKGTPAWALTFVGVTGKSRKLPHIQSMSNVANAGTITVPAGDADLYRVTCTGATATLGVPTGAIDGDPINLEVLADVALTLSLHASIINASGATFPASVGDDKRAFLALRPIGTTWRLLAYSVEP